MYLWRLIKEEAVQRVYLLELCLTWVPWLRGLHRTWLRHVRSKRLRRKGDYFAWATILMRAIAEILTFLKYRGLRAGVSEQQQKTRSESTLFSKGAQRATFGTRLRWIRRERPLWRCRFQSRIALKLLVLRIPSLLIVRKQFILFNLDLLWFI